APARLSRGGHFLRSAARRRRDRRPAEGRNRQPGQHGRPRSARRAAPRTGRRDARRAAPARRARGVLGRRPGRALSALLRALRRRRRGAGGAGRENEPPGDRGGRGRSPRGGGNRSGADAVLTWQTGFPFAVDFGRGYPTYRPHAGAAERLAGGEVDAALVIGAPATLPRSVARGLVAVATVAIGPRASAADWKPVVAVDTGVAGIHEGGT